MKNDHRDLYDFAKALEMYFRQFLPHMKLLYDSRINAHKLKNEGVKVMKNEGRNDHLLCRICDESFKDVTKLKSHIYSFDHIRVSYLQFLKVFILFDSN